MGGMVQGPEGMGPNLGWALSGMTFQGLRLNFGVRPCQPKNNRWNFPKLVGFVDVEMFCCFFLGFLFGAFFFSEVP